MKFSELELDYGLHDGIASLGFEDTTPIQEQAIPMVQEGHDLIAFLYHRNGKDGGIFDPFHRQPFVERRERYPRPDFGPYARIGQSDRPKH